MTTTETRFDRILSDVLQAECNDFSALTVNGQPIPEMYCDRTMAEELLGLRQAELVSVPQRGDNGEMLKPEDCKIPVSDPDTKKIVGYEPYNGPTIEIDGTTYAARKVWEKYHFTHNKTKYVMEQQDENRDVDYSKACDIAELILEGRFVLNGETWIVDRNGKGASLQHRALGLWIASETDADVKIPIILVHGIDPRVVDTIDTGRSRTNKDVLGRRTDLFDSTLLVDKNGAPYMDPHAVESKLNGDLASAARLLYIRTSKGKDINAAGQVKGAEIGAVEDRFINLPALTALVYRWDSGDQDGYARVFSRPMVIAALALWSGKESDPLAHYIPDPKFKNRGTQEFLPLDDISPVSIDLGGCTEILKILDIKENGPMGSTSENIKTSFWSSICKQTVGNQKGSLKREYRFATLVNLIQAIEVWAENSGETDDACEYIHPGLTPKAGSLTSGKGAKKVDKSPRFGGIDTGSLKGQTEEAETTDDKE